MALVQRVFDSELDSVAAARHFARDVLTDWGVPSDDVELVVTELATNALLHARSDFGVSLDSSDDAVMVEVTDSSGDIPRLVPEPFGASRGRGLVIVERLCRTWGTRSTSEGGKAVWAELEVTSLSGRRQPLP